MGPSNSPKTAKDYEENERTSLLLAVSSLQNEDWQQAQRCWGEWLGCCDEREKQSLIQWVNSLKSIEKQKWSSFKKISRISQEDIQKIGQYSFLLWFRMEVLIQHCNLSALEDVVNTWNEDRESLSAAYTRRSRKLQMSVTHAEGTAGSTASPARAVLS